MQNLRKNLSIQRELYADAGDAEETAGIWVNSNYVESVSGSWPIMVKYQVLKNQVGKQLIINNKFN